MMRHGCRAGTFCTGWAGRVATALMAAVVFVVLLVVGALTVAIALASAVVMGMQLWWLSRRRLPGQAAGRGGNTLEGDYEVVPSDRDGDDQLNPGKRPQ